MAVRVRFRARVGGEPFACGREYADIGTSGGTLTPADLRFYVQDLRLVRDDGEEVAVELDQDFKPWQLENVALLDFEDGTIPCDQFGNAATNDVIVGTAPAGDYHGIQFTMGVPFERNHGNQATAPDPLSLPAMFWSWQAGYKFLRIDTFNLDSGEEFRIHLGSTGCAGEPPRTPVTSCARPNRVGVVLDDFDPAIDVVVADLAALLAGSDIDVNTAGTPPGCMGDPDDPECGPIFAAFGLEDGISDPARQAFFRAERTVDDHAEVHVGSTEEGGGRLTAELAFDGPVGLFFNECLEEEGDECHLALYSAVNPGISLIEEDEPEESRFVLADGTALSLEITAIDAMLGVRLDEQSAGAVGESIDLGTAPELHADLSTQLVASDEQIGDEFRLSFRLRADSERYEASDEITVRFVPLADEGGHDHDDDGDDDDHDDEEEDDDDHDDDDEEDDHDHDDDGGEDEHDHGA
jgi:uncharacterized repeat protein (TIGR04052 family)